MTVRCASSPTPIYPLPPPPADPTNPHTVTRSHPGYPRNDLAQLKDRLRGELSDIQTTTETSTCRDIDVIGRQLLATSSLQLIDRNDAPLSRKAISAKIDAVLPIWSVWKKARTVAIVCRLDVLVSRVAAGEGAGGNAKLQPPYFTTVFQQHRSPYSYGVFPVECPSVLYHIVKTKDMTTVSITATEAHRYDNDQNTSRKAHVSAYCWCCHDATCHRWRHEHTSRKTGGCRTPVQCLTRHMKPMINSGFVPSRGSCVSGRLPFICRWT